MNKFKLLLATGLIALTCNVSAAQIEGGIRFGGAIDTIDIVNNTVSVTDDEGIVTALAGSFVDEGIAVGDVGTYNSFSYSPISGANPLWSIGGFDFELTNVTFIDESTPGFLDLLGTGTVTHASYGDTLFKWSMSIDSVSLAGQRIFAFSSTNLAIPEPGIMLLLATGLIGFGFSRRASKAA